MADSIPDVIFMSWIPKNRIRDWIFFHHADLVQYANFDKEFCRASVDFEPPGDILAHFDSIHWVLS